MILDKNSCSRIIDNLHDGLYWVDRDRIIQYWSRAAERISGYAAAEVVGRSCSDNILTHMDHDGNSLCCGLCPLAETIGDGVTREAEVFMHHKHGHRVPVSVRVSTLTDEDGLVIGGVELFSDLSNLKAIEVKVKELEKMALLDSLTRLPNRSCIEKELLVRFEERKRFDTPFGILFMDIDHFKIFNDTYGHDVGDQVLRFVADTIVNNSRPFDVVGRWGGEEFIGIVRNVTPPQLKDLGNRLRLLIENSYICLDEDRLHVTISTRATNVRDDDTLDTLLKRADTLLYDSKRAGRNYLTLG